MWKPTIPLAALLTTALCAPAWAQEAAPAADPAPVGPQLAPYGDPLPPVDLGLYRDHVRQLERRSRQIARLNHVIDREGPEFSEARYAAYRSRLAGGVLLVVVGGGCLFASVVYGIASLFGAIAEGFGGGDYEEEDTATASDDSGAHFAAPMVLIPTGVAALGIGIPLIISGASGKHRQELLLRKDEILAPIAPPTAAISLFGDPASGAGGVRLQVTF
jgi:hypothetical protein